jgi:hypothetical protein
MILLVRHGPPPGDTEDPSGELHSAFAGFFILPLSPERVRTLFGTDGSDAEDPAAFVGLVRQIWKAVTGTTCHGHILIGICSGFEHRQAGLAASCGSSLGPSMSFAPKDYVPLYAVARAYKSADAALGAPGHIDLAVDYRNTRGPGDPAIRPTVF